VTPPVLEGLLESRTRGLLRLFDRKSVLPRTIRFLAALGDRDAVRDRLDVTEHDSATVNAAFMIACHFKHDAVASLLLERATALDAELGRRVDTVGRAAFITFLSEERALTFVDVVPSGPWQAYLMERVMRAVQEDDMPTFAGVLQREPWLLGDDYVRLHVGVVERAILRDRGAFIEALFGMMPALVTLQPPPRSGAIEFAFTYAKTHLLPILTRVWPIPDDLPHAAGTGDFARVKHWLDQPGGRGQRVLDHALAWSVLNRHFDVADCLLEHGADINTRWASHEPASLLHELVFRDDYDAMRFLIDRGIDMTITDYRWRATAQGWARYGANDEKMAAWLADAERQQKRG
jgi:hypothetical protein